MGRFNVKYDNDQTMPQLCTYFVTWLGQENHNQNKENLHKVQLTALRPFVKWASD